MGCSISCLAQTSELQSLGSFKVGLIGAWISYEKPLNEKWLIHTEIGQEGGVFSNSSSSGAQFVAANSLSLEPRFYYNRDKRENAGKNMMSNSGNYLALEIQYISDWLTISSEGNVIINPTTSFIPKIGMRRAIGKSMTFELAGGIGYAFNSNEEDTIAIGLDVKIGFLFFKSK